MKTRFRDLRYLSKMKYVIQMTVLLCLLYSCQGQKREKKDALIDKEKIDLALGTDVSQVHLSHLYVVLDSFSYAMLTQDSDWRNSYARLDKGLPDFQPIDDATTISYLRGYQHYIEILKPNNTYSNPIGKSGIGFLLQNHKEGFHDKIKPKLKPDADQFLSAYETVQMPIGESRHLWFKAFYTPMDKTKLDTWYAFYDPTFLAHLHGFVHGTYRRESFIGDAYDNKRLFRGVEKIALECSPMDYYRIGQEMRYLGTKLVEKQGDTLTIAVGDIHLQLSKNQNSTKSTIKKIWCKLNRADDKVSKFGNLVITNSGHVSVWTFDGQ